MSDRILSFMKENDHCVICSISPQGEPQSAFVGYSVNDDFELMVGTTIDTRKYRNIRNNPAVSIVVGSADKKLAVQYEGNAVQLGGEELDKKLQVHYKVKPGAAKYRPSPTQVYFKIKPKWVRLVDANLIPLRFEEIKFP